MVQTKRDKYTLKKKHIWPSVFLFFSYTFIVWAVLFTVIGAFSKNVVHNKFMLNNQEVDDFARKVNELALQNVDRKVVLDILSDRFPNYQSVAIIDDNRNVIAGYGSYNPDWKRPIRGTGFVENRFYHVENSNQPLLIEGKTNEYYFLDVLKKTLMGSWDDSKEYFDKVVYTETYWMTTPLEQDGESLLLECSVILHREDLFYAFWLFASIAVLINIPVIILLFNVVARVTAQRRIYEIFYYDPVTKGKNWVYFMHFTEKKLSTYREAVRTYAIVDFELQKYRSYCACNGVEAGEELLERINRCIEQQLGKKELCVRYAKSNYALLLFCMDEEDCVRRIQSLYEELAKRLKVPHLTFHSGIYMLYPERRKDTGRIVRRTSLNIAQNYNYAGEARASIEDSEENEIAFFDEKMLEEQKWEHWVENTMEHAMANEEFVVYLQPKYNPVNDKLVGAEALVRWISPEKGFIPPYRFIPIFEKNGFISKLDDYMVSHVAKEQARWIREGKEVVPVSVNVSRVHFASEDLAEHICSLVDEYKIPHGMIEIELTESAFFDNKKTLLYTVNKLKEYGFELSMDDFGAGYSSLNSLKDLPLDVLKLDAEFFRGDEAKSRGDIIVGETIQLAKLLNMRTVAEGIETKEQIDFLAEHGCDMIQGYYYAKPMPVEEFEERAYAYNDSNSTVKKKEEIATLHTI